MQLIRDAEALAWELSSAGQFTAMPVLPAPDRCLTFAEPDALRRFLARFRVNNPDGLAPR